MKRKALMARLDLADKITEIASSKGTLYDYLNDILQQAIRAEDLGLSLKSVLDDMWLIKKARDAGFTVIPEKIIYDLTEQAYIKKKKEKVENLWYETGKWYGQYFETLNQLQRSIGMYFWDITEFKTYKEEDGVTVISLSSKFSYVYTKLFSKFLEGALNVQGYSLKESEISKGIIKLHFCEVEG
jgi:hypothetical protein